ncbi:MAG: solute carrier family 23 protein [Burkholderiales bacterium]
MARPTGLIYDVNETPPLAVLGFSTVQHAAVISTLLVYPVILATEAKLSASQLLDLVALSMIAVGVGTVLMTMRTRWVGSGYLCPAGFSLIYLGPSLYALHHGGLAAAFGMTMVAGVVQLCIAPVLPRLRALLPPEIAGIVVAITGLSLAVLGTRYGLGLGAAGGIRVDYVSITLLTLAIMIGLNTWTRGYPKMFSSLIGAAFGMIACKLAGIDFLTPLPAEGFPLLKVPSAAHVEWRFDLSLLAPFVIAAVATTVLLMGNVSTAQRMNDTNWVRPSFRSLSGGLAGSGLTAILCGLIGSPGLISSTSSIGLSQATGVTSRSLGYAIGALFAVLAFVPWAVYFLMATTAPVMAAMLIFTSMFVLTNGLQMITARMLDQRRMVVIGLSFAMAVMADVYRDAFATLPDTLQPVFGNSLVLGTTCAVVLNLVMRIGIRERETLQLAAGADARDAVEQFMSEHGARWAARHDVVNRAKFCLQQAVEVIGHPPGGIEVVASFDEFNLDVRLNYEGVPLPLPERKPDTAAIMADDDGERLLAGYLLRGSADKVQSTQRAGRTMLHFHFDH